jgi:DNA-binding transcriptional MerR regulator
MAKKKSCELYPLGKDKKPSQLYKDILKYIGERPVANYIYAAYTTSAAAQMDSLGYTRNIQGEHKMADVEKVLDIVGIKRDIGSKGVGISKIARTEGATDMKGNPVDFSDARKALEVAQHINNTYKGAVAAVYAKGDKFNVVVDSRNSRTQIRSAQVEKQLQQWDVLKQAMNTIGVDLDNNTLSKSVFNATNVKYAVQWLHNAQITDNKYFSRKEIKDLLSINEATPQVQRLKQMFGTLDEVAQKIYDAYRVGGVTSSQMSLIDATLNNSKKLNGLDLKSLETQVNSIEQAFGNTEESRIENTLKNLNKKYNIDAAEILLVGKNIRSLSQAAAEAAIVLQRQLKQMKAKVGVTPETTKLEKTLNILTKEISANRYYAGVLGFLGEASTQIQNMENMLKNTPQSGTNLQRAAAMSKTLMQVKAISEGYENILRSLANIDKIVAEERISDQDRQNIKDQATKLVEFFDNYKDVIEDLKVDTMTTIATEYLGDRLPNGEAVVNIVSMANADSSIYDFLYSVGRVSDPLIATMGNIIRDTQSSRDAKMNAISLRIRRADNKLRKAGFNSEFMYEPNGYIISDIDWSAYNKAKYKYKSSLKGLGNRGISIDEAMKNWEEANTEDRVVDAVSGRTEKVPNATYRKAFPQLTAAQREYYTTMMQIKGELGTLLPNYAQRQYMPPQVRRSFIDAIGAAWKHKNIKELITALRNRFKDLTTIREDDTRYAKNGIVNGEEFGIVSGALDNTPYRQIPIFYINRIEDKGELLKDFSSAVQHLAGTAINYEVINNIKDTVEFMGDFIRNQEVAASSEPSKADLVENTGIRIFKKLVGFGNNSNTTGLIDGFIDKHIYGVQLKDSGKYHVLLRNLLAYTSLKSLAVNVKGAISNYLVGELQMLVEAGGGEFYNAKDYLWAHGKVFGDNTTGSVGRIMDFMTNDVNSKSVLLAQIFDPLNENFGEQTHERYHRGIIRHLVSKDLSFIGYGVGEHLIHFVTMYAVLHNTKVKINGQQKTLYDVFSVGNKVDGNSELIIDKNATYTNDEGQEVPIDNAFLEKIRGKIRYTNQTMHGSMNEEDKGLIQQHMAGRFVMNLRQWMVEHYSRRYRGSHYDATLGEYREGFYNTTSKFAYALAGDIFRFQRESMLHWKDMNNMQKSNVKRAMSELAVLASLLTLSFALGEPDEHKKEWLMRMWIYQTKRAITDVNGSTPWGVPMEMNTLINSPIAASNVVNAFLYPFVGISDIGETVKSGKHKGENRYVRNITKYLVPFYGQIEQLSEMGEDNGVFQVFDKNNLQK